MRSVTISQTGVGASSPAVLDRNIVPFNVGISCLVTGTATYTIQHTFADPFASGGLSGATWFDHDVSNLVGATTNINGNFAYPCTASRINITSGSGTVSATYVQGVV